MTAPVLRFTVNSLLSSTSPLSPLSTVLNVATTLGTPSLTALCRGPGSAETRIPQQREAESESQENTQPDAGWLGL